MMKLCAQLYSVREAAQTPEGGTVLILDELYICPSDRHHGYASAFMEWLAAEYKDKAVSITLEVLTSNQSAQALYKKEGFSPDGFVTMTKVFGKQ